MAKARSPAYPAIGLKEAVENVRRIYENDYQSAIPRAVAAAHMGYKGLNGKSLGVLSALSKFNLLEGRGDNTRVSDLAVQIIAHPSGSNERWTALEIAALSPDLFVELDQRAPGGRASDQAIRSYLLTRKFIPAAADAALRAYRETMQFLEEEQPPQQMAQEAGTIEQTLPKVQMAAGSLPISTTVKPPTDDFQISISSDRIVIAATLTNQAKADDLIAKLAALKPFLPLSSNTSEVSEEER